MDDGIDEAFHPCVFGNDPDRPEATIGPERLSHGELFLDDAATFCELVGYRTFDAHVGKQLLADSGRGSSVACAEAREVLDDVGVLAVDHVLVPEEHRLPMSDRCEP